MFRELAVGGVSCGLLCFLQPRGQHIPPVGSDLCSGFPQEVTCWPLDILFSVQYTNKFKIDVVNVCSFPINYFSKYLCDAVA